MNQLQTIGRFFVILSVSLLLTITINVPSSASLVIQPWAFDLSRTTFTDSGGTHPVQSIDWVGVYNVNGYMGPTTIELQTPTVNWTVDRINAKINILSGNPFAIQGLDGTGNVVTNYLEFDLIWPGYSAAFEFAFMTKGHLLDQGYSTSWSEPDKDWLGSAFVRIDPNEWIWTPDQAAVPEPSTWLLFTFGLAGVAYVRRCKNSA